MFKPEQSDVLLKKIEEEQDYDYTEDNDSYIYVEDYIDYYSSDEESVETDESTYENDEKNDNQKDEGEYDYDHYTDIEDEDDLEDEYFHPSDNPNYIEPKDLYRLKEEKIYL